MFAQSIRTTVAAALLALSAVPATAMADESGHRRETNGEVRHEEHREVVERREMEQRRLERIRFEREERVRHERERAQERACRDGYLRACR